MEKRSKQELATEAVKKYLESEGFTVLGATLTVEGIKPVPNEKYGHALTIKFDGAKG